MTQKQLIRRKTKTINQYIYIYTQKHIYIYIYIYIVIHRQTVSLCHNSSVRLNARDAGFETRVTLHQSDIYTQIHRHFQRKRRNFLRLYLYPRNWLPECSIDIYTYVKAGKYPLQCSTHGGWERICLFSSTDKLLPCITTIQCDKICKMIITRI